MNRSVTYKGTPCRVIRTDLHPYRKDVKENPIKMALLEFEDRRSFWVSARTLKDREGEAIKAMIVVTEPKL